MSHSADQDLNSQQHHLAATSYDLRITNLARFIYSRLQTSDFGHQIIGSKKLKSDDRRPTSRLIDIGAGNGLFLKFFKQKGYIVSGIELEKELVANMKKDPELKGVSISQGDITKITNLRGSESKRYDVVLASDVIEHIQDDKLAIAHLWSHVAPGGLLVITVPAYSHLYGKRDKMWGHYRRYDAEVLKDRIKGSLDGEHSRTARDDKDYTIVFVTHWNIVGYFIYFLYEKILHKSINEKMRYSNSIVSKIVRGVLDGILKIEEVIGGLPLGLTLVAVVRKQK